MKLRDYQLQGLDASKAAMERGVYRQIVVMATGLGKTPTLAELPDHLGITRKVLVIAHTDELIQQAEAKIQHWNPDKLISVEMGDRVSDPDANIIVASVQTLGRSGTARLRKFNPEDFGIIIVDEVHHAVAASYQNIFRYFGLLDGNPHKILLYGTTATPTRSDKVGLAGTFDEIVFSRDMLWGIKNGWLATPRAYRIKTKTSLDAVDIVGEDLNQGQLSLAVNTPERNRLVVEEWRKHAEGMQTVAFCVNIAHAEALSEAFRAAGVKAEAVWGNDPLRPEKMQRHKDCEFTVLCNAQMLIEGYDDWRIRCIIVAKPTQSAMRLTQMIGRGTRLPDGVDNLNAALERGESVEKTDFIVLDIADVTTRHSLQTVPSLFGLPPKMDLKGVDIVEAREKVMKIQNTKPEVDFSECEDLEGVETYAEHVDLFTLEFPQEVKENSEFQWLPDGDGGYQITLPKAEAVFIKRSDSEYDVYGKVDGYTFGMRQPSLTEAFSYADRMLRRFGRRLINLLRREPAAGSAPLEPVGEDQIRYLTRKLERMGLPIPDWSRMSRHDARQLFLKLGREHQFNKEKVA